MEDENISLLLILRLVLGSHGQGDLWHEGFEELLVLAMLPVLGPADVTAFILVVVPHINHPERRVLNQISRQNNDLTLPEVPNSAAVVPAQEVGHGMTVNSSQLWVFIIRRGGQAVVTGTVGQHVGVVLKLAGSLPLIVEVVLRLAPMEGWFGHGRRSLLETDAPLHHEVVAATFPLPAPQAAHRVEGRLGSLESFPRYWRVSVETRLSSPQWVLDWRTRAGI